MRWAPGFVSRARGSRQQIGTRGIREAALEGQHQREVGARKQGAGADRRSTDVVEFAGRAHKLTARGGDMRREERGLNTGARLFVCGACGASNPVSVRARLRAIALCKCNRLAKDVLRTAQGSKPLVSRGVAAVCALARAETMHSTQEMRLQHVGASGSAARHRRRQPAPARG